MATMTFVPVTYFPPKNPQIPAFHRYRPQPDPRIVKILARKEHTSMDDPTLDKIQSTNAHPSSKNKNWLPHPELPNVWVRQQQEGDIRPRTWNDVKLGAYQPMKEISPEWGTEDARKIQNAHYTMEAIERVMGGQHPVQATIQFPEVNAALRNSELPLQEVTKMTGIAQQIQERKISREAGFAKLAQFGHASSEHLVGQSTVNFREQETRAARFAAMDAAQETVHNFIQQAADNATTRGGVKVTYDQAEAILGKLSDQQHAFVTSPAQTVSAIAGPGSGKSTSIAGRVVHQQQQGIAVSKFKYLAPSNASAEALVAKVQAASPLMPGFDTSKIKPQTFWSMAMSMLHKPTNEHSGQLVSPLTLLANEEGKKGAYANYRPMGGTISKEKANNLEEVEKSLSGGEEDYIKKLLTQYGLSTSKASALAKNFSDTKNNRSLDNSYKERFDRGSKAYAEEKKSGRITSADALFYAYEQSAHMRGGFKTPGQTTPVFDRADTLYMTRRAANQGLIEKQTGFVADEIQGSPAEAVAMLAALTAPASHVTVGGDMSQKDVWNKDPVGEFFQKAFSRKGRSFQQVEFSGNFRSDPWNTAAGNASLASAELDDLPKSPYMTSVRNRGEWGNMPQFRYADTYQELYQGEIARWFEQMQLSMKQVHQNMQQGLHPLTGAAMSPQQAPFIVSIEQQRKMVAQILQGYLTQHLGPTVGTQAFNQIYTSETPSAASANRLHVIKMSQAKGREFDHPIVNVNRVGKWGAPEFQFQKFTNITRARGQQHFIGTKQNLGGGSTEYDQSPDIWNGRELPHGSVPFIQRMIDNATQQQGLPIEAIPDEFRSMATRPVVSEIQEALPQNNAVLQQMAQFVQMAIEHNFWQPGVGDVSAIAPVGSVESHYEDGEKIDYGKTYDLTPAGVAGDLKHKPDKERVNFAKRMMQIIGEGGPKTLDAMWLKNIPDLAMLLSAKDSPFSSYDKSLDPHMMTNAVILPTDMPEKDWGIRNAHDSTFVEFGNTRQAKSLLMSMLTKPAFRAHPQGYEMLRAQFGNNTVIDAVHHAFVGKGEKSPFQGIKEEHDRLRGQAQRLGRTGQSGYRTDNPLLTMYARHAPSLFSTFLHANKDNSILPLLFAHAAQESRKQANEVGGDAAFTNVVADLAEGKGASSSVSKMIWNKAAGQIVYKGLDADKMNDITDIAHQIGGDARFHPRDRSWYPYAAEQAQMLHNPESSWGEEARPPVMLTDTMQTELHGRNPMEALQLRTILKGQTGEMDMESKAIQKLIHERAHTPALAQRLVGKNGMEYGITQAMSRTAPFTTEMQAYAQRLEQTGIVDPMAGTMKDGQFQPLGAAVPLGNYQKRLEEMLGIPGVDHTGNASWYRNQPKVIEHLQDQHAQVKALRGVLNDPLMQEQMGHFLNIASRVSTTQGATDKEGSLVPLKAFFGPQQNQFGSGQRSLEGVMGYMSALTQAMEHTQRTGTIRRGHLDQLLGAMGHDTNAKLFAGLRHFEKKGKFTGPEDTLSLDELINEFPGNGSNLAQEFTRYPIHPNESVVFTGTPMGPQQQGTEPGTPGTLQGAPNISYNELQSIMQKGEYDYDDYGQKEFGFASNFGDLSHPFYGLLTEEQKKAVKDAAWKQGVKKNFEMPMEPMYLMQQVGAQGFTTHMPVLASQVMPEHIYNRLQGGESFGSLHPSSRVVEADSGSGALESPSIDHQALLTHITKQGHETLAPWLQGLAHIGEQAPTRDVFNGMRVPNASSLLTDNASDLAYQVRRRKKGTYPMVSIGPDGTLISSVSPDTLPTKSVTAQLTRRSDLPDFARHWETADAMRAGYARLGNLQATEKPAILPAIHAQQAQHQDMVRILNLGRHMRSVPSVPSASQNTALTPEMKAQLLSSLFTSRKKEMTPRSARALQRATSNALSDAGPAAHAFHPNSFLNVLSPGLNPIHLYGEQQRLIPQNAASLMRTGRSSLNRLAPGTNPIRLLGTQALNTTGISPFLQGHLAQVQPPTRPPEEPDWLKDRIDQMIPGAFGTPLPSGLHRVKGKLYGEPQGFSVISGLNPAYLHPVTLASGQRMRTPRIPGMQNPPPVTPLAQSMVRGSLPSFNAPPQGTTSPYEDMNATPSTQDVMRDIHRWNREGNLARGIYPPSDEQLGVLDDPSHHKIIEGGPGGGKTATVDRAIMDLIASGEVKPNQVKLLSAMHSGTEALNKGFDPYRDLMPKGHEYQLNAAQTFHSLAAEIALRQDDQGNYPVLQQLGLGHLTGNILEEPNEDARESMTAEQWNDALTRAPSTHYQAFMANRGLSISRDEALKHLTTINEIKNQRGTPDSAYDAMILQGRATLIDPNGPMTQEAKLALYEQGMHAEGNIDYGDLPYIAHRALDELGPKALSDKLLNTRVFGLDEAQDATTMNASLFQKVLSHMQDVGINPRVFVGMDRMQSLMQGLGGIDKEQVLGAFQGMLGTNKVHQLTKNFRSDAGTVALNNALLQHPLLKGRAMSPEQVPVNQNIGKKIDFLGLAKSQPTMYKNMFHSMIKASGISLGNVATNIAQGKHALDGMDWSNGGTKPSQVPAILSSRRQQKLFAQVAKQELEGSGLSRGDAAKAYSQLFRRNMPGKLTSRADREQAKTQFPVIRVGGSRSFEFQQPHVDVSRVEGWASNNDETARDYLSNVFTANSRTAQGGQLHVFAASHPFSRQQQNYYAQHPDSLVESSPGADPGLVSLTGGPQGEAVRHSALNAFEHYNGQYVPAEFSGLLQRQHEQISQWQGKGLLPSKVVDSTLAKAPPPRTTPVASTSSSPKIDIQAANVNVSVPSGGNVTVNGDTVQRGNTPAVSGGTVTSVPAGTGATVGNTPLFTGQAIGPMNARSRPGSMGMAPYSANAGMATQFGNGGAQPPSNGGPGGSAFAKFNNTESQLGHSLSRIGGELQYLGQLGSSIIDATVKQGSEYRQATIPVSGGNGTQGFFDFSSSSGGINAYSHNILPMYSNTRVAQGIQDLTGMTNTPFSQSGTLPALTDIMGLSAMTGISSQTLMGQMTGIQGTLGGNVLGGIPNMTGMLSGLYGNNLTEGNVSPTLSALQSALPTVQGLQAGGSGGMAQVMAFYKLALQGGMTSNNLGGVSDVLGSLSGMGNNPNLQQQYMLGQMFGMNNLTGATDLAQFQSQQTSEMQSLAVNRLQQNIGGGLSLPNLQIKISQANIQMQQAQLTMSEAQLQASTVQQQQSQLQQNYNVANFNEQQSIQNAQYGPIGMDSSKTAYFSWLRSKNAAQYNGTSPEIATQFQSAPTFGLQNAEFYAGLEHQRTQMVLSRSPLLSDMAFQENNKYINQQEAFYQAQLKLTNQQRSFEMDWQPKLLAGNQKVLDVNKSMLGLQAQELGVQQEQFVLAQSMAIYEQKNDAITQQYLKQQGDDLANLVLQQQQKLIGLGPVNGKNVQPDQIVQALANQHVSDTTLRQQINAMGLPLDQQQTLMVLVKQLKNGGKLSDIEKQLSGKGDKALQGNLQTLIKNGAFASGQDAASGANAALNYGGTGAQWTALTDALNLSNQTTEQLAKEFAFTSPFVLAVEKIANIMGPLAMAVASIVNIMGTWKALFPNGFPGTGSASPGGNPLPGGVSGGVSGGTGTATPGNYTEPGAYGSTPSTTSTPGGVTGSPPMLAGMYPDTRQMAGSGIVTVGGKKYMKMPDPKRKGQFLYYPLTVDKNPNAINRFRDVAADSAGNTDTINGWQRLTADPSFTYYQQGGQGQTWAQINGQHPAPPHRAPYPKTFVTPAQQPPGTIPKHGGLSVPYTPTKDDIKKQTDGWTTVQTNVGKWWNANIAAFFTTTIPTWWTKTIWPFLVRTVGGFFNWLGTQFHLLVGQIGTMASGFWDGFSKSAQGFIGTLITDGGNFFSGLGKLFHDTILPFFTKTLPDFFTKTLPKSLSDTVTAFIKKEFGGGTNGSSGNNPLSALLALLTGNKGGAMGEAGPSVVSHGGFITPNVNADFHAKMNYGVHQGVDFAAAQGTPLEAFDGGKITGAGFYPWGGEIDVDIGGGLTERYLHLSMLSAHVGQMVKKGQRLGLTGGGTPASGLGYWSSGAHSHVQIDEGNINAGINPWPIWALMGDNNISQYYNGSGMLDGPTTGANVHAGGARLSSADRMHHLSEGGVAMTRMRTELAENGPEAVLPLSKLASVLNTVASGSTATPTASTHKSVTISKIAERLELHVHTTAQTLDETAQDSLMAQLLDIFTKAINDVNGKLT